MEFSWLGLKVLVRAEELEKSGTERTARGNRVKASKTNILKAKLGAGGGAGTRGNVGATSFMKRGLQGVGEKNECGNEFGRRGGGGLKRKLSRRNLNFGKANPASRLA